MLLLERNIKEVKIMEEVSALKIIWGHRLIAPS